MTEAQTATVRVREELCPAFRPEPNGVVMFGASVDPNHCKPFSSPYGLAPILEATGRTWRVP